MLHSKWLVRSSAVAIGLVLVIFGTGCTKVVSTGSPEARNVLTSAGQGTVAATPDEAEMTFGASARSASAKSALATASKTASKITAAVKSQGVPTEDIQTISIELSPRSSKVGRTYMASIIVRAIVTDLTKVGDVVSAAERAGATSVSGPSFSVSDSSPARTKALAAAVEDAKKNAATMAKAAGQSLGAVVSITNAPSATPTPQWGVSPSFDSAMQYGYTVPVTPGQMDITQGVTVVFELK